MPPEATPRSLCEYCGRFPVEPGLLGCCRRCEELYDEVADELARDEDGYLIEAGSFDFPYTAVREEWERRIEAQRKDDECGCGGPARHVPGGIWCRK